MNKKVVPYASLDLQFLTHKKSRVVSSQEALKDIEPVKWDSEILKGKKKVTVWDNMEHIIGNLQN